MYHYTLRSFTLPSICGECSFIDIQAGGLRRLKVSTSCYFHIGAEWFLRMEHPVLLRTVRVQLHKYRPVIFHFCQPYSSNWVMITLPSYQYPLYMPSLFQYAVCSGLYLWFNEYRNIVRRFSCESLPLGAIADYTWFYGSMGTCAFALS